MVKLSNQALTKICLIGFLFSFSIIFYLESKYNVPIINIENISSSHLNKHVTIHGEIISQRKSKTSDTVFIKIKDETNTIDAILFNTNQTLNKSNKYLFEGKVDYYKDRFQIITKNIYS